MKLNYASILIFLFLAMITVSSFGGNRDDFYTPAPLPLAVRSHSDGRSTEIPKANKSFDFLRELSDESEKVWLSLVMCNGGNSCAPNDEMCWSKASDNAREYYFAGRDLNQCEEGLEQKVKSLKLQLNNLVMTDSDFNQKELERYENQSGVYLSPLFVQFVIERIISVSTLDQAGIHWPTDWRDEEIDSTRRATEILLLLKKEECDQWGLWPKATQMVLTNFEYSISPSKELYDPAHGVQNSWWITKLALQVSDVLITKRDINYFASRRYGNSNLMKLRDLAWVVENIRRSFDNFVACGFRPEHGDANSYILKIHRMSK